MPLTFKDRVKQAVSAGGTGALTLGAASSGFQAFGAGDDAKLFPYVIEDGTAWETGYGTYTHSGTSFARTSRTASSTGSALTVSTSAFLYVDLNSSPATWAHIAAQAMTPGGRLTLQSGQPLPWEGRVTPSATDTTLDTVTLPAGHGLSTGAMVSPYSTVGGLTIWTTYYLNVSGNTASFHTTVANAEAGTSKVDLTATITADLYCAGYSRTSVYYTPSLHNVICLWDGNVWTPVTFAEQTLAIGTATAALPYDVFAYLSSGALAVEKLAWSSATARATDITVQDGRYCKSGDKTRLYLGTIYTSSTTTVDDQDQRRGVFNAYNRATRKLLKHATTSAWTYGTQAWRAMGNDTANRVEVCVGLPTLLDLQASELTYLSGGANNIVGHTGICRDGTNANHGDSTIRFGFTSVNIQQVLFATLVETPPLGFHFYQQTEYSEGPAAVNYYPTDRPDNRYSSALLGKVLA